MKTLLSLVLALSSLAALAQPIVLEPIISNSCGYQSYKVRRLFLNPDGTSSGSTAEFEIPSGYNLEITDVEMEHGNPYAPVDHTYAVYVQNKASGNQWTLWETKYITTQLMSGTTPLSPGVQTGFIAHYVKEHRNFATPFVASSAARICTRLPAWGPNFVGRIRVTGRLVAVTAPVLTTSPGTLLSF